MKIQRLERKDKRERNKNLLHLDRTISYYDSDLFLLRLCFNTVGNHGSPNYSQRACLCQKESLKLCMSAANLPPWEKKKETVELHVRPAGSRACNRLDTRHRLELPVWNLYITSKYSEDAARGMLLSLSVKVEIYK